MSETIKINQPESVQPNDENYCHTETGFTGGFNVEFATYKGEVPDLEFEEVVAVEDGITKREVINLKNKIKHIAGIVFNKKGEVLIVKGKKGNWMLPGGKMDKSDKGNWQTTLERETIEEGDAKIDPKSIQPAIYQKLYDVLEDGSKVFRKVLVRKFARIEDVGDFKMDDEDIVDRKFVPLAELGSEGNLDYWDTRTIELLQKSGMVYLAQNK